MNVVCRRSVTKRGVKVTAPNRPASDGCSSQAWRCGTSCPSPCKWCSPCSRSTISWRTARRSTPRLALHTTAKVRSLYEIFSLQTNFGGGRLSRAQRRKCFRYIWIWSFRIRRRKTKCGSNNRAENFLSNVEIFLPRSNSYINLRIYGLQSNSYINIRNI